MKLPSKFQVNDPALLVLHNTPITCIIKGVRFTEGKVHYDCVIETRFGKEVMYNIGSELFHPVQPSQTLIKKEVK